MCGVVWCGLVCDDEKVHSDARELIKESNSCSEGVQRQIESSDNLPPSCEQRERAGGRVVVCRDDF